HTYHFHIRLACPAGEAGCKDQAPPPADEGCGKDLDYWFSSAVLHPKPGPAGRPLSVSDLPEECRKLAATAAP
ncbi:MAG: penicillin-insensitive murein endopeptidase, partial [Candidatus Binatia bacterium]